MISYEEAKKTAFKLSGKVNACREYKAAYHFYEKGADADGDNGVVVLKDKGGRLRSYSLSLRSILRKHRRRLTFDGQEKERRQGREGPYRQGEA